MKIFAIVAAIAMAINFVSVLFAPLENQSGNGVYYGSAAETDPKDWDYDNY